MNNEGIMETAAGDTFAEDLRAIRLHLERLVGGVSVSRAPANGAVEVRPVADELFTANQLYAFGRIGLRRWWPHSLLIEADERHATAERLSEDKLIAPPPWGRKPGRITPYTETEKFKIKNGILHCLLMVNEYGHAWEGTNDVSAFVYGVTVPELKRRKRCPTHERYDWSYARTDIEFYCYVPPSRWNVETTFLLTERPPFTAPNREEGEYNARG